MLYAFAEGEAGGFNDITSGDNKCTRAESGERGTCCKYGFEAAAGWDAATGLAYSPTECTIAPCVAAAVSELAAQLKLVLSGARDGVSSLAPPRGEEQGATRGRGRRQPARVSARRCPAL